MRPLTYRPALLLLLVCAGAGPLLDPQSVLAQARLREQGSAASDLERIALKAEAEIEGQFATTRMEITYRNTGYGQMEADFEYVLPPDTLVSSFAYWYRDEKVVARVVEKERAAEIYRHITTRKRDPALIERVNERTFRARIFPIEGGADLRVEMVFRQVLPSDAAGMVYHLPLVGSDASILETIDARVRVRPDVQGTWIRNNLGIPVLTTDEGAEILVSGQNYRPPKDLRVRIKHPASPLRASLLAAPSGGSHGFFALALTPSRPVAKPVVRLGGSLYAVHVPSGRLRAHQTLTVTGRYRKSGPLDVTLSDAAGSYRARTQVELGREPVENGPAALLWASREIPRRERAGRKRSAVELSKRFGLPGKDTSWLAVPKEEMELYRREKDEERIAKLADSLAEGLRRGQDRSSRWKRLHAKLDALCKRWGRTASSELEDRLSEEIYLRAQDYLNEKYESRPDPRRVARLKAEAMRLAVYGSLYPEAVLESYEKEVVRYQLVLERAKAKPDTARIETLEQRYLAISANVVGEEYPRLVLERIAVRAELEKVAARLAQISENTGVPIEELSKLEGRRNDLGTREDRLRLEIEELEKKQGQLTQRERELRARAGDPLIAVEAPADALRVVALMPDGTVKPLTYRPESGKWEVRFDIPTYAAEGGYTVQVITVQKDGRRQIARFTFTVDMTAPQASARALNSPETPRRIWIEIDAAEDTARVAAFLPGGESVSLRKAESSRYCGWVELPPGITSGERVKIVVTDRAHNRTTLEVEAGANTTAEGQR